MMQKLFSEIRMLYGTEKERPNIVRFKVCFDGLVDQNILRCAVDQTMKRYPYFCVELRKQDNEYVFAENNREVVIADSEAGRDLNTPGSNYHMLAFSSWDNWIVMDIYHAMTDGTGAYEIIKTLLTYYCAEKYDMEIPSEGVRLVGDEIPAEEWEDPLLLANDLPIPPRTDSPKPLQLTKLEAVENDRQKTVYHVALNEEDYIRFVQKNGGGPSAAAALLLSKAIAEVCPNEKDVIRIAVATNERGTLKVPLAHQSLVGGAMLEYKDELRSLTIEQQIAAYQKMVKMQTSDQIALIGIAAQKGVIQMILSKETEQERFALGRMINAATDAKITATVSYIGKAEFGKAKEHIRDFRVCTGGSPNTLAIELSAVNGKFYFDFIQPFSSTVFLDAFLNQLRENSITCDLMDKEEIRLPNIVIAG